MKSTGIKVIALTSEEMLNHHSKSYNPTEWSKSVERMIALGAKFYEATPDECYGYSRFFTEYKMDGLYFFRAFDPFCSVLSNRGFTRVVIVDGEIYTNGFGQDKIERVTNSKAGRKWLAENVCDHGVMVSSSL